MTWLAILLLRANPSEGEVNHEVLIREVERVMDGPEGCWQAEGTARWSRTGSRAVTAGETSFVATLSDHRWVAHSLESTTHSTTIDGRGTSRVPVRPFV